VLSLASQPAQEKSITVASTTSTQDSGLFDHILPLFTAKTGIDVRVVAQGTGEALKTARRGAADVVFVHDKSEEEKFLAEDACGFKLANDGQDTRALQHYLGHKNIQHTVRYTELSPERFKSFWQD
jgi:ABC-type tungstate transport system permease subunit